MNRPRKSKVQQHTAGGDSRLLLLTPFHPPTLAFSRRVLDAVCAAPGHSYEYIAAGMTPVELGIELALAARRVSAVVAVLDRKRPNVMFEIGFLRALGHEPLFLTRRENHLHGFVDDADLIRHGGSVPRAASALRERLNRLESHRQANADLQSELPPLLSAPLVETLARTVHDRWMAQRLADGWTHGPARDDEKKQHPSLIAYADLSESEKDYDRQTALETLKAIIALGYRIER